MSNIERKCNKLDELKNRSKELQVAVYGKYNHGKSSLLNALIKHQNKFKVADKRETVKIESFLDENNHIFL